MAFGDAVAVGEAVTVDVGVGVLLGKEGCALRVDVAEAAGPDPATGSEGSSKDSPQLERKAASAAAPVPRRNHRLVMARFSSVIPLF